MQKFLEKSSHDAVITVLILAQMGKMAFKTPFVPPGVKFKIHELSLIKGRSPMCLISVISRSLCCIAISQNPVSFVPFTRLFICLNAYFQAKYTHKVVRTVAIQLRISYLVNIRLIYRSFLQSRSVPIFASPVCFVIWNKVSNIDIYCCFYLYKMVTSMLVTDVGDQMCWWQISDVGDRFNTLGKSPT